MEIAKRIICRACGLPKNGRIEAYWELLKALIAGSSPTLLDQLGILEVDQLDQRSRISVERYFNRAKFRPIPYAEFATVGLLQMEREEGDGPMLSTEKSLLKLRDWTEAKQQSDMSTVWTDKLLWRRQATLYAHRGSYYFFQSSEEQTELFSLECFAELDRLLGFCEMSRTTAEIRTFAGEDWDVFRDMMAQLLELQVLVNSQLPNLTGMDYFQRLGVAQEQSGTSGYMMSFRHGIQGFCDLSLERELKAYVAFAQQHLVSASPANLSEFKRAFSQRYENRWQLLSLVLDPAQGLGYAGLAGPGQQDIESLLPQRQAGPPQLLWDELSPFLMKGMASGTAIDLKEFKGGVVAPSFLPNTLNVLLQPAGEQGWAVEHMGGPSATTLVGRFAQEPEIRSFASELTVLEQQANPRVKFFDIAYQTGYRTDNINRRPQLYALELVLGGWSTHPDQLQFSDLFVNVIGDELVLYSQKHQCRVVPRMASAYNILRSSHPLLRLLADLQYQGMQHQFLPNLQQRFPDMDQYPPLKFGTLLLQPAKWKVPFEAKSSLTALEKWSAEAQLDRFVRIGHADQYLCLDLQMEMDRKLLWDSLQRDTSLVYISAWTAGSDLGMADTYGDRFSYQLQMVMTHEKEVYAPVQAFESPSEQFSWAIGEDWLYCSLYTAAENQSIVLRELVAPLLASSVDLVENWFYILYHDPEPHIRLRIRWKEKVPVGKRWRLMAELGNWLGRYGIRDTTIRPYAPERQRYGLDTMELVESFFGLDSREALLEMGTGEQERLASCYGWIWGLLVAVLPISEQRQDFIKAMAALFAREMGWEKGTFKLLNQSWRNMAQPALETFPSVGVLEAWEEISLRASSEKREQLLGDLIHMHINRRFPSQARLREAQLYQYLLQLHQRTAKLAAGLAVR